MPRLRRVRVRGNAADRLRAEDAEELDLAGFTLRYGTGEALLLLDTMFTVCGADGTIEPEEVRHLQDAARELGVDGVLVSALLAAGLGAGYVVLVVVAEVLA